MKFGLCITDAYCCGNGDVYIQQMGVCLLRNDLERLCELGQATSVAGIQSGKMVVDFVDLAAIRTVA